MSAEYIYGSYFQKTLTFANFGFVQKKMDDFVQFRVLFVHFGYLKGTS